MGTEKSTGPGIFSVSGKVERPGNYEAPMGTPAGQLIEMAGGVKDGKRLKAWTPGGSGTFPDAASRSRPKLCRSSNARVGAQDHFLNVRHDVRLIRNRVRCQKARLMSSRSSCKPRISDGAM